MLLSLKNISRPYAAILVLILLFAAQSFAQSTCQPYDRCAVYCSPSVLSDIRRSKFRGWDFLVSRLRQDGVDEGQIRQLYQDPRMPAFGEIPFRIRPVETAQMYTQFLSKARLAAAHKFMADYSRTFGQAEKKYKVGRHLVAAILLIETHFGQNTGQELVINRLSRVASVGEPCNMIVNFRRLRRDDPEVKFSDIVARAHYLEAIFYPEIPALFDMAKRFGIDVLSLRGSVSGAFGMPQFLPTTFMRYATDGNGDGRLELNNPQDAIYSTANFLANLGWRDGATYEQKRQTVWRYNHSDAYVDSVLHVATVLKRG
jgi:membrane-bound lytic murein transglycosylase B